MLDRSPAMPTTFDHEIAKIQLPSVLTGVAYAPLAGLRLLRVTGEDRVRWLNGMVTNSIQSLKLGEGCYSFFLNAQGRIQGDATAFLLDDALLLQTDRARLPALTAMLDHFIIMDDVELSVDDRVGLAIVGAQAAATLDTLGLPSAMASLQLVASEFQGMPVDVMHASDPITLRFELWAAAATIERILEALRVAGVPEAADAVMEQLRLLAGTPRYGEDIRDKELPQETAQTRALHFAKGCYLGQEIVERIRSRGNVHRTFAGFVLDGPVPLAGTPLFAADAEDKAIGELTSAETVDLPSGTITLALGYVRREALERGVALRYEGGVATPTPLPYPVG